MQLLDDIDYAGSALGYMDEDSVDDCEIYLPQIRDAVEDIRGIIIDALQKAGEPKTMKDYAAELEEMIEPITFATRAMDGGPWGPEPVEELERIAKRLREIVSELREEEP